MPSSLWISPTTMPSGCADSSSAQDPQARLGAQSGEHVRIVGGAVGFRRSSRRCFHTSTIVEIWNLSRSHLRPACCTLEETAASNAMEDAGFGCFARSCFASQFCSSKRRSGRESSRRCHLSPWRTTVRREDVRRPPSIKAIFSNRRRPGTRLPTVWRSLIRLGRWLTR